MLRHSIKYRSVPILDDILWLLEQAAAKCKRAIQLSNHGGFARQGGSDDRLRCKALLEAYFELDFHHLSINLIEVQYQITEILEHITVTHFYLLILSFQSQCFSCSIPSSSLRKSVYLSFRLSHRDSRQGVQLVQWLHEWQGAADGLQHADGGPSSAALQSPAPLQFPLREVWRLCLAQRGRAGPQVRRPQQ